MKEQQVRGYPRVPPEHPWWRMRSWEPCKTLPHGLCNVLIIDRACNERPYTRSGLCNVPQEAYRPSVHQRPKGSEGGTPRPPAPPSSPPCPSCRPSPSPCPSASTRLPHATHQQRSSSGRRAAVANAANAARADGREGSRLTDADLSSTPRAQATATMASFGKDITAQAELERLQQRECSLLPPSRRPMHRHTHTAGPRRRAAQRRLLRRQCGGGA